MTSKAKEREVELKRKKNEKRRLKRGIKEIYPSKKTGDKIVNEHQFEDDYEIEYVPEEIAPEYGTVLAKFVPFDGENSGSVSNESYSLEMLQALQEDAERKAAAAAEHTLEEAGEARISNRAQRLASRMSIADLKSKVDRPDLVDGMDNCSPDPLLLLMCKSYRNVVQIPRHWSYKRNYLANKRGVDKIPFKLPEYIEQTGIAKIRQALIAKEAERDIKAKQRSKMRPKSGRLDIDYQVLHDSFFKYQTKPANMTRHGDMYYEGRESETRYIHKRPGQISPALREALGMIEGSPPPWLINMQRFGPPPSYPHLKIPGLNAPIPVGAEWGYHPGGWGRPPLDEFGNPIYGGLWNPETDRAAIIDLGELQARKDLWGEFQEEDSEDEEEEVTDVTLKQPTLATSSFSQGVAVSFGAPATISAPVVGPSSVPIAPGELYKVLQQKAAPSQAGALFPSKNVYELSFEAPKDVTGGLATATGIAKIAHEIENEDVITADMIKKQLAEYETVATSKGEKKKKKDKFKF
jgi:splicing factor 3B subunit 2